jgi:serine/threonine-protein kinase
VALNAGTRLGPYEIADQIGVGGMGEVYRATDTNLKRQVAIKVLPDAVAGDAERLARFQREAEVLASLNHPNIAQIHGLERGGGSGQAGTTALVMELVEGPTLADRIAEGPIPVDEALPIAKQIAEALEVAHEQGIVHRDLKPANVKVRPDGTVKVLDFGLAKAMDPVGGSTSSMTLSPTITTPAMTQAGLILGTAAYMAPEQARGKPLDRRADIWAFGVVLFEMLAGRRAFEGEDVTDTLAAVVRSEPDWSALPAGLPARVVRALRVCLQKNPRERGGDIGAIRLALEGAFETTVVEAPAAPTAEAPPQRILPVVLAAVAMTVILGVVVGWLVWPSTETPTVTRFEITTPPDAPPRTASDYSDLAISPDGTRIAYGTGFTAETVQAYVREIDQLEATAVRGTEFAADLFFSPDGERIGFRHLQDGPIRQVSVRGGPTATIASIRQSNGGASWAPGALVVYGSGEGLWRVPAAGGAPEQVTTTDPSAGVNAHYWPDLLPDGRAVLFTEIGTNAEDSYISVVSLETGEVTRLLPGGGHPRYAASGHILYGANGTLWAAAFDPARLELTGNPVPVVEEIVTKQSGAALFDIADNGSLVYVTGAGSGTLLQMIWVERNGRSEPVDTVPAGAFLTPRLSPDDSRVLVGNAGDAWVYDLADGRSTRLTTDGLTNRYVVWDPTGARVAYSSTRGGPDNDVWVSPVDGSEAPELLVDGDGGLDVEAWSPDGTVLAAHQHTAQAEDMVMIGLEGDTPEVRPFRADEFATAGTTFSPDGRYVAYMSNESGRQEVYVRPFPGPGGQVTVSVGGGREPVWAPSGELFYRSTDGSRLMVVDVQTDPTLRLEPPEEVFSGQYFRDASPVPQYDVTSDGQRFLLMHSGEASDDAEADRPRIVLIQNFFEVLRQIAPAE